MLEQRRAFLKWFGGVAVSFLGAGGSLYAADLTDPKASFKGPLVGVNAYYLLVESYRKVVARSRCHIAGTVMRYLTDDLRLFELRDKCCLNALRFWSFNDYPAPFAKVVPGAFDGRLWRSANTPDALAFDVLEALLEALEQTELFLIPVLGNYWTSYGGILQYLVWSGELSSKVYQSALCQRQKITEELYLKYTRRFFTSAAVEQCYRSHTAAVLKCLARNPRVVIVDVLNEPRGKTASSLANKPDENGLFMSDIVARWLNRQALWIKQQWPRYSPTSFQLSSGEEGWSQMTAPFETRALKKEGQSYEGIDFIKNLTYSRQGLDIASVHLYTHRVAEKQKRDVFNCLYTDARGWEHLLKPDLPRTRKNFRALSREWILSRSQLLKNRPWYIGEMGWCWPRGKDDVGPLSSDKLQPERIELYRQWTTAAIEGGALGICLWMLNGCQHQDDFYGMSGSQISEILGPSLPNIS